MPDESAVPEFSLPDWGTEGAPPEPSVPDDADSDADLDSIEIAVERPMLLAAGALPSRWNVRTVHGLVTGFGRSDNDDHAVESATAKALGDISESAQAMGANAVVDVGIAVSGRKSKIVVTAWGTAVSFSR